MKCPKCQAENAETSQFCADCGTRIRGHVPDSPESGTPRQNSKDVRPEVTETLQKPIQKLTTGSTFAGRFEVIEELGKGGMGRVYKVFDSKIKEKVALKLIRPEVAADKDTIERFVPEPKTITSREITVKVSLKKLYIPAIGVIAVAVVSPVILKLIHGKHPTPLPSGKPCLAILFRAGKTKMKCPKCHFDNASDTKFCGNCAAPLSSYSKRRLREIRASA